MNEGLIEVGGGAADREQKVQALVGFTAKCDVLVLMPKMLL